MSAVRAARICGCLVLLAMATVLLALAWGSNGFAPGALFDALLGDPDSVAAAVVLQLRLPRVITALSCGGLLALSGALMQVLFRNPLADPYVLGLAGGAGTGALCALAFGAGIVSAVSGAWAGAFASVVLLLWFGRGSFMAAAGAIHDGQRLLLVGVALASGWTAVIALVLALAPDASPRGLMFWMMGDLDAADGWAVPAASLLVATASAFMLARDLDALSLGSDAARSLGVPMRTVQLSAMLIASAATAVAVTSAGAIGFVGLIVPNAVRRLCGSDHRVLLPGSALAGGILLVLADALARIAIAPMQLPVGAIVALVGVPAFVMLVGRLRLA